jgi:DNA polymerase-3 subunit delta'
MTTGMKNQAHWGLLGHDWAVDLLKQQIIRRATRHAYLFCGSPGVGRRSLALRFSQALNCQQQAAPAEPCLECRTCRQIERMEFPDLTVLQAEQEGGVFRVDWVRAVRQSLWLKPFQSKYRLALLLRFQEANENAANALLKILEEPPEHAILILTADSPEQLPATISSRCEVLRLRPSPIESLEKWLLDRKVGKEDARLLAHISAGRPGAALRWLENEAALEARRKRLDELVALLHATRVQRFAYADKLADPKKRNSEPDDPVHQVLLLWLSFWRDVFMQTSLPTAPLTNVDYSREITSLAGQLSNRQAQRLVSEVELAIDRLGRFINARLLMEVLLLDMPRTA